MKDLIIGIHWGHDAGVVILINGKNVFSISEERLNRKKNYSGFPYLALSYIFDHKIIIADDVKTVVFAGTDFSEKLQSKHLLPDATESIIRDFFKTFGIFDLTIDVWDHHLSHAASAYYGSGFKDALVVTSDGLGDGLSGSIYVAKGGTLEKINDVKDKDSIGLIYSAVTSHLGFIADRHEGKITGLASYGKDTGFYDFLESIYDTQQGHISRTINFDTIFATNKMSFIWEVVKKFGFCKATLYILYYLDVFNKRRTFRRESIYFFDKKYSPEDFAYGVQTFAEDILCDWIGYWVKKTGLKKVVLAGGCFANVKINQRITERCGIDDIFIYPNMGDGGLSYGVAALEYYKDHPYDIKKNITDTMYLGPEYSDAEIVHSLKQDPNIAYEKSQDIAHDVAELIANRTIVGWFQGRMEFGPRALGARSIVAMADDATINDWLNKRMERTEFMPFAPSVLADHMDDVFIIPKQGFKRASEFMTITYDVREKWQKRIAAVNHVDNTARPQMVSKQSNRLYYDMLSHVYDKTGIPLTINTSFNVHEEPIVMTPNDALKSLHHGIVDVLAIGNYLVRVKHDQ